MLLVCLTQKHLHNRGGASEASVATFTNHVAGNRAISYMVVYPSYTTCVNTCACANGAEIAIFEIIFLPGKETLGKKDLFRRGLEPGSDALQTTAFATEPMGLWQLWTANLALILLTAGLQRETMDGHHAGISGESQQTQALQGILTVLFS